MKKKAEGRSGSLVIGHWTSVICLALALGAGIADGAVMRNRGVAALASAALPGTGQLLLGTRNRGEAMLWVDGVAWLAYSGFTWYGSSREQDARLSAARESGADISVQDRQYYTALERYANSDQYNEDIRREARSRYPSNPELQHQYYLENGYFDRQAWAWSSDSARYLFWRTRRTARTAAQRAGFAGAGLMLNRLVSAADCAFFVNIPALHSRFEAGSGSGLASLELRYRF